MKKSARARRTQGRRLYRRLAVQVVWHYRATLATLQTKDIRAHAEHNRALTRTYARILRVEALSGVQWPSPQVARRYGSCAGIWLIAHA